MPTLYYLIGLIVSCIQIEEPLETKIAYYDNPQFNLVRIEPCRFSSILTPSIFRIESGIQPVSGLRSCRGCLLTTGLLRYTRGYSHSSPMACS